VAEIKYNPTPDATPTAAEVQIAFEIFKEKRQDINKNIGYLVSK